MNPNIVFVTKSIGVLLAFGTWGALVWHGNTPADGFVAGLLSLIGFLTGHEVGKSSLPEVKNADSGTMATSSQSGTSPGAGVTGS